MVADDMAQFLDKLEIKQAHIIGYSCGAYVCCYMAAKYPDKVKSLVTIGGATGRHIYGIPSLTGSKVQALQKQNGRTSLIRHFSSMERMIHLVRVSNYRKKFLREKLFKFCELS